MSAADKTDYRVPAGSPWAKLWVVPAVLTAVGAVGLLLGLENPERMGYSYLFGFFTALTFVLGGLFLVLIQHLTAGHWGVTTRRIPEVIMSGAIVMLVLAIPLFVGIATGKFTMYDEWMGIHHDDHAGEHDGHDAGHGGHSELALGASIAHAKSDDAHAETGEEKHHTAQEEALHHSILEKKAPYLNKARWFGFGVAYLLIWWFIAAVYFRWSRKQDETKDPHYTILMKRFSAVSLIVWALALTFAAFDWLMALEPAWFSTIFGVVIFAGSAVAILAVTTLIALSLFQNGLVGDAINHEHFHDLGKLLFGFVCFWAYVQFSQWMLIWYAGIPEEATWFHKRWTGGWTAISLMLMIFHFVLPFVLLISRLQKRALGWLKVMCIWMIAMHVVDIYWFVLPQAGSLSLGITDFGGLLFACGALFTYVLWKLSHVPLLPIGDPRLARSLHHHQTH